MAVPRVFDDICRLCCKVDDVLIDVFDNKFDNGVAMKIYACLAIYITPEDKITKKVCTQCLLQVISFCHFQSLAVKCNSRLLKEYEEQEKIKVEIIEETKIKVIAEKVEDELKPPKNEFKICAKQKFRRNRKSKKSKVKQRKRSRRRTKRIVRSFLNSYSELTTETTEKIWNEKDSCTETVSESTIINYTFPLSQDSFMRSLELTSVLSLVKSSKQQNYHPSVKRIKELYSNIRLPENSCNLNLAPHVLLNRQEVHDYISNTQTEDVEMFPENLLVRKDSVRTYMCMICTQIFDTAQGLRCHKTRSHERRSIRMCTLCNIFFKSDIEQERHILRKHPTQHGSTETSGSLKPENCPNQLPDHVRTEEDKTLVIASDDDDIEFIPVQSTTEQEFLHELFTKCTNSQNKSTWLLPAMETILDKSFVPVEFNAQMRPERSDRTVKLQYKYTGARKCNTRSTSYRWNVLGAVDIPFTVENECHWRRNI